MKRRRSTDDSGSALMIAILTAGVCISLALIGIAVAQQSTRASGVDRQEVLAVSAAEAGVDGAYVAVQNGGATPPCSFTPAVTNSGPDTATYTTTIKYYDAAGNQIACTGTPATLPAGVTPARALVQTRATTNVLGGGGSSASRGFEALLALVPATGNNLGEAIFADSSIGFTNATTVYGKNGADGDIYSNASITCTNSTDVAGSVFTQGNFSGSNSCNFGGTMWAKGYVKSTGPAFGIGGAVKSSTSYIDVDKGSVGGNLYAGGTITAPMCPSSKCYPSNSPGDPPVKPFPQILADVTPWTKAVSAGGGGYTPYVDNDCSNIVDDIISTYATKTGSTILSTDCAVNMSKKDITLSGDLVIMAKGGFSSSNLTRVYKAAGAPSTVHVFFIQPYDAVTTHPCTSNGFVITNQFSLASGVESFVYTPCTVKFTNNGTMTGQIYAGGQALTSNQLNLQFSPQNVFGVVNGPPASYKPSILYKREVA